MVTGLSFLSLAVHFDAIDSTNMGFLTMKVYPGKRAAGSEADKMAANELNAHAFLQVIHYFIYPADNCKLLS